MVENGRDKMRQARFGDHAIMRSCGICQETCKRLEQAVSKLLEGEAEATRVFGLNCPSKKKLLLEKDPKVAKGSEKGSEKIGGLKWPETI